MEGPVRYDAKQSMGREELEEKAVDIETSTSLHLL